jgi:hypothetical protein
MAVFKNSPDREARSTGGAGLHRAPGGPGETARPDYFSIYIANGGMTPCLCMPSASSADGEAMAASLDYSRDSGMRLPISA